MKKKNNRIEQRLSPYLTSKSFTEIVCWLLFCILFPVIVNAADEKAALMQEQLQEILNSTVLPAKSIISNNHSKPVWQQDWEQAREAARRGELSVAGKDYETLLKKYPGMQHARWELVGLQFRLGDLSRAAVHLELLVEAEPENISYLSGLAYVLLGTDRLDRAIIIFEDILSLAPANETALKNVVYICLQLKKVKRALQYQEKLHRLFPDDRGIRLGLAKLYEKLGLDDMARPHLVSLAKDPSADGKLLEMTALVHDRLGLDNLAVQYWQRVLAQQPNHSIARMKLARAEEKAGRIDGAVRYLRPILEISPVDPAILWEVSRLLVKEKRFAEALPYLEQSVALKKFSLNVLQSLVEVYAALGKREEIIAVLEKYFSLEAEQSDLQLRHAARLFGATGRFREAVPFYRRLLAIAPDDPDILQTLATDLINVAQNDGKLGMRRYFKRLGPERVELYRSMAELLKKLGRTDEYLEVLEIIHDLQPSDTDITLELAGIFLEKGDLIRSLYFFERLFLAGDQSVDFYEGRGTLYEKSQKNKYALDDLEKLLRLAPDRHDIRLRAIHLAGQLGLLEKVRIHFNKMQTYTSGKIKPDGILIIAGAFRDCGAFNQAKKLYGQLLVDNKVNKVVLGRIYLEFSKLYQKSDLVYEAQENFRKALLFPPEGLEEIFGLLGKSSATNETLIEPTQKLFTLFGNKKNTEGIIGGRNEAEEGRRYLNWNIAWLRARLFAVEGRLSEAILQASDIFYETKENLDNAPERILALRQSIGLDLAGYYLENDQPAQGAEVCRNLLEESRASGKTGFDPLFMLLKCYQKQKMNQKVRDVFARILFAARQDTGRVLVAAQLAEKHGMPAQMLFWARTALDELPGSLKAKLLLAEALNIQGGKEEARGIFAALVAQHPDCDQAATGLIRLLFKNGAYLKVVALCEAILERNADRVDIILLKARSLWALQRYPEALAVYDDFLTPSADELFAGQLFLNQFKIEIPAVEPSFWQTITFSAKSPSTPLELALAHVGLPDDIAKRRKILNIAVSYFSLHNWQQRFRKELAARKDVTRTAYYRAIYEYKDLIAEYRADESLLFDLAGIYSRLDMLRDEALLYERISGLDPSFPGLQSARKRNWLKRRPRVALGGGYLREKGYFGYKSMEKEEVNASFWMSPKPQHELYVALKRIGYSSMDISSRIASRRFYLSYGNHFMNGFSLSMGAGFEDLEDGYPSTGVFNCKVAGKLGERLSGNFAVNRDLVTDTTASLMRNIIATDISSGLSLDLLPHFKVGGDYGVRYLSDNNYTLGYELWTTYQVFKEPFLVNFKYAYDFKESKNGSQAGVPLDDGFGGDDHPYWAPKNYWQNRFELFFKHQLSDDFLRRGVPRYYTLRYSLDYDALGYGAQTLAGSFFLEWTPRFIIEASTVYKSSQISRIKEMNLNAVYRW